MQWQQKVYYLTGQPIGVSFMNGQGTTGVLCGISEGKLQIIEYLYQGQFALKQYDFYTIRDINGFPSCPQNHNHHHHHQQRLY